MKRFVSVGLIVALATSSMPRVSAAGVQTPQGLDWAAVRKLSAGTPVMVTVKDSGAVARFIVVSDETSLTLLNLSNPPVPPDPVAGALLQIAKKNPQRLAALSAGGELQSDSVKGLRVMRDGLFLNGGKIAEVDQILQRVNRQNITSLRVGGSVPGQGIPTSVKVLIGVGVGLLVFALVCRANGRGCIGTG